MDWVTTHTSRLQSVRLMSGGSDTSKLTIRSVQLRWRSPFFSRSDGLDKGDSYGAELLTALLRFSRCFGGGVAVGEFLTFLCVAALTFLCKCVFVQALLNPRPLPCNASKTIHLHPPREWRVFDGWGSPLHPRCGLETGVGWCHYASHRSGNVSSCRRPPCWTLMESCMKSGIACKRRACLLTWAFGESLQFTMTWFQKSQATRNWPTPVRGDVENLTGLGNGFLFKRLQSLDWNTIREWRTLTLA